MAEGVQVRAMNEAEAETKAKALYSPWDISERLELAEE